MGDVIGKIPGMRYPAVADIADLDPRFADDSVQIVVLIDPVVAVIQTEMDRHVFVQKTVAGIIHSHSFAAQLVQDPVDVLIIRMLIAEHHKTMRQAHLAKVLDIFVCGIFRPHTQLRLHQSFHALLSDQDDSGEGEIPSPVKFSQLPYLASFQAELGVQASEVVSEMPVSCTLSWP